MPPGRRRSLFREVNQSIREVSTAFSVPSATLELLCECEHPECLQRISVPLEVYDAARAVANRFVVATGHGGADDDVVSRNAFFSVVNAAAIARSQLRVA